MYLVAKMEETKVSILLDMCVESYTILQVYYKRFCFFLRKLQCNVVVGVLNLQINELLQVWDCVYNF
jgi:hypothetical protein